jgi:AraC-type DNA-binding domain-containing proteins
VTSRYHSPRERITYQRRRPATEKPTARSERLGKVVTLVESTLEAPIASATRTCCRVVHARSIPEAIFATRDREAWALLVSPNAIVAERKQVVASLLGKCSGLVTVAIVKEPTPLANQRLLELGALGVRQVIDLSGSAGWNSLRDLVAVASEGATPVLLAQIMASLTDASPESCRFMETLIRRAPHVRTVRELSRDLGVHPSSLMSRFYRSQLPAPKRYLAAARLLYASAFFESSPASIASISNRLDYSSPQSFGRHVRLMMGMTASHFRYRFSQQRMVDHFIAALITPHRHALRSFDPWRATQISGAAAFQVKGNNGLGPRQGAQ